MDHRMVVEIFTSEMTFAETSSCSSNSQQCQIFAWTTRWTGRTCFGLLLFGLCYCRVMIVFRGSRRDRRPWRQGRHCPYRQTGRR